MKINWLIKLLFWGLIPLTVVDDAGGGAGDPPPSGDSAPTPAAEGGAGDPPPSGDSAPTPPAAFAMPDDWRANAVRLAGFEEGEDFDKRVGQLDRFSDLGSMTKSLFEANDKIRKGEISNGLPENATDEQMTAYREAQGIPETAADYNLTLDDGLVLGEADNAVMGGVFDVAHANNVSSETMNAMTNAMLAGRQAEADKMTAQDGLDTQTASQQLKDTWGQDFETNKNVVAGLVNQLPESVKEAFQNARMPDGKAIFNSPEIMVAMAEWGRKIDPSATVVPGSNNPMKTMTDEIKSLEAKMGTPDWYKDTAGQQRYQDLITAQERMQS